jgi:hypothetical protein
MQRISLVFTAVFSAAFIGCGGGPASPPEDTQTTSTTADSSPSGLGNQNPEKALDLLPPKQRAQQLREMKDAKVMPRILNPLAKKYEKDPDPEVAAVAKEILEGSKSNAVTK